MLDSAAFSRFPGDAARELQRADAEREHREREQPVGLHGLEHEDADRRGRARDCERGAAPDRGHRGAHRRRDHA